MSPNLLNRHSVRATSTAKRSAAVGVAAAIAAAGLGFTTAVPAAAAPYVMPVGGQWDIVQDGNGFRVRVNLHQDGGHITGTASTAGLSSNDVTGWVDNHHLYLRIPWTPGNSIGDYNGELTPNKFALPGNYLDGNTCDQTHPGSCSHWYSEGIVL